VNWAAAHCRRKTLGGELFPFLSYPQLRDGRIGSANKISLEVIRNTTKAK